MTAELVRSHTEFPSLEDYLNGYAITGSAARAAGSARDIITSLDDPIIPAADCAHLAPPAALSPSPTRYGGHCGFFERLPGPTWLEGRFWQRPAPRMKRRQR